MAMKIPRPHKKAISSIYPMLSFDSTTSSVVSGGTSLAANSEQGTPKHKGQLISIMIGSFKNSAVKLRRDFYGARIDRRTRSHHIAFKDAAGEHIADIIEVESYKEENKTFASAEKSESSSCCQIV